jgi:soluble lytic murein transglycosylase-like protein
MELESSFRPDAHAAPDAEALSRGVPASGAWGLLQLLQPTAADMVIAVRRRLGLGARAGVPSPADTLTLWDPAHAECLANPALGSLLGVAYLDHLAGKFGPRLDNLAAAYHNGPGYLKAALASGKKIPEDLPPKGKAYVLKARALWPKYSADDADDGTPTPPQGIPRA